MYENRRIRMKEAGFCTSNCNEVICEVNTEGIFIPCNLFQDYLNTLSNTPFYGFGIDVKKMINRVCLFRMEAGKVAYKEYTKVFNETLKELREF